MKALQVQMQKYFYDPDGFHLDLPEKPTDEEIRVILAQNNSNCPLNHIVVSEKNEKPMYVLRLMAFDAYRKFNRSCRGKNFGIYSSPGQGKTTVVKRWSETIGIPLVFIQSSSLKNTWQLFSALKTAFAGIRCPLVPQYNEFHYIVPPCIVFFDEAHDLSLKLRRGGLLNPMEANDGWLITSEEGKKTSPFYYIDCQEVCWVAASTDPGIIYEQSEAFYDRFSNHLIWHSAGKDEIARIVSQSHHEIPEDACKIIAFYAHNPRKANAFAGQVIADRRMMCCDWTESCQRIASVNQIDEYGMGHKELLVLKTLGQRPVAKQHLVVAAQCRLQELEKMILPALFAENLIAVTHKGCAITRFGLEELNKRGIENKGDSVVAERILAS